MVTLPLQKLKKTFTILLILITIGYASSIVFSAIKNIVNVEYTCQDCAEEDWNDLDTKEKKDSFKEVCNHFYTFYVPTTPIQFSLFETQALPKPILSTKIVPPNS
jgi:hypothetical protein